MDNEKLFYEDNKEGKNNIITVIVFLAFAFVGWLTSFILSFIPIVSGSESNIFSNNLGKNIFTIVFLTLLLLLIILLIIYVNKSVKYKNSITITETEIRFGLPVNNRTCYKINEYQNFEILQKINDFAKIKLNFAGNISVFITTRKFDNLKNILNFIQKK